MSTNLQQRFDTAMSRLLQRAQHDQEYDARLGSMAGELWADRAERRVWARIELPTGITEREVYCAKVTPALDMPVTVRRHRKGFWEVIEEDPALATAYWGGTTVNANVGAHGSSHLYGSLDPTVIDGRQWMHGRVYPTDTLSLAVNVSGAFYRYQGAWAYAAADTLDLTALVPSGANLQRCIVVGIDKAAGAWDTVNGAEVFSYVTGAIPFDGADVASVLAGAGDDFEPIAAVRLYGGQTAVRQYDVFLALRSASSGDRSPVVTRRVEINARQLNMGSALPTMDYLGSYPYVTYAIGDNSRVSFAVPDDWVSGTEMIIKARWACNDTSGEVRWAAAWACTPADCDEAVDGPAHSGSGNSGDVVVCATAKALQETTVASISGTSIQPGDQVGVQFSRVALGDGSGPGAVPGVITLLIEYTAQAA